SKTHTPPAISAALAAGLHDFGENRVQEAETKITTLAEQRPAITWHLIGHLQSNKARRAATLFDYVHSVDSVAIAQALDRHAAAQGRRLPILLQVNVSGEASKDGFALAGWEEYTAIRSAFFRDVAAILALGGLDVRGLMTIAPLSATAEAARPTFRATRRLRDTLARQFNTLSWNELSMGMTDDFEIAIEEGATQVRVGRAIFGARPV
ncbi:MAG TPA: YggS family pyridoxal phosphate-dependent enzyme, partial [Roseiflexaceae bacterium]|nr:YggS family pyridoxal phosphate-dependent enzyme [Roseiflexaceae bacterium]